MFHIKEYDEDPALQQQQGVGENDDHDSTQHDDNHHHHRNLLTVNTSIPRREYKVDLSSLSSSSSSLTTNNRVLTTTSITTTITTQQSWYNFWRTPKQVLIDLFLPLGFPHSVDSSYLSYQFYDSLQGLCSYLRGVVSTSAVLQAAGVGDSEATAMGAAMTWALKDGMGMIGGLIFSYFASPQFDAYVLEFRLFADLINDVALTLDMMAPLVPSNCLLWLMSASTLSKTMCGMSAGATKSSITVHLALEGNMADLNAKEGTQETLVSLLGMMLGVQLAKQLERLQQAYQDQPFSVGRIIPTEYHHETNIPVEVAVSWFIFLFLTWLHMWANYRGVKLLKLKSLNRERAMATLDGIVASMADKYWEIPEAPTKINLEQSMTPSPDEIEESMIRATLTLLFPRYQSIALGVPLLDILQSSMSDPESLMKQFQNERYILGIRSNNSNNNNKNQVMTTLRTGANNQDELKAFLHSMLVRKCLDSPTKNGKDQLIASPEAISNLIQITHSQLDVLFGSPTSPDDSPLMKNLAEVGWDVESRLYLGFGRRRTSWESSKTE